MLPEIDFNLLLIQGGLFLVVLWVLKRFLFEPLLNIFHEREERTEGLLKKAEKTRREAQKTLADYEARMIQARKEILDIKKTHTESGKQKRDEILRKARSEAQGEIEQMRGKIKEEIDSARDLLQERVAVLGRQIAEKVLGRSI